MGERLVPLPNQEYLGRWEESPAAVEMRKRIDQLRNEVDGMEKIIFDAEQFHIATEKSNQVVEDTYNEPEVVVGPKLRKKRLSPVVAYALSFGGSGDDEDGGAPTFQKGAEKVKRQPQKLMMRHR